MFKEIVEKIREMLKKQENLKINENRYILGRGDMIYKSCKNR